MTENNGNKLISESVILDVTFKRPGIRRRADISKVTCEADKEMLGLSKAILDSEEYRVIQTVVRQFRSYVEAKALDCPLKRGSYMVPLAVLEDVYGKLEQAEIEFNAAVEQFIDAYPQRKAEAEVRLKDQFRDADYPEPEQLREAFEVVSRLVDFSPPGEGKIGQALSQKARQKFEQDLKNASEEIQAALREAFAGLVKHLRERLESISGGGKKILAPSAVDNLLEFIDNFKHRNLCEDAELEGLVAQAKNVLAGKDSGLLKSNGKATAEVLGEMKRCEEALSKLVKDRPTRLISFGEDD